MDGWMDGCGHEASHSRYRCRHFAGDLAYRVRIAARPGRPPGPAYGARHRCHHREAMPCRRCLARARRLCLPDDGRACRGVHAAQPWPRVLRAVGLPEGRPVHGGWSPAGLRLYRRSQHVLHVAPARAGRPCPGPGSLLRDREVPLRPRDHRNRHHDQGDPARACAHHADEVAGVGPAHLRLLQGRAQGSWAEDRDLADRTQSTSAVAVLTNHSGVTLRPAGQRPPGALIAPGSEAGTRPPLVTVVGNPRPASPVRTRDGSRITTCTSTAGQRRSVASIPGTVPKPTVITLADFAELALFHHWVAKPESPQPTANSILYCPGARSSIV